MEAIEVRDTTLDDIEYLKNNMREIDKREIWLSDHSTPSESLDLGLESSVWCKTVLVDGKPALVCGVSCESVLSNIGVPWLLGTDELPKAKRVLIDEVQDYIDDMFRGFDILVNYVWAENTVSVNWLKRIGFHFDEAEPYGPEGALFHKFYKVRGGFNV